MHPTLCSTPRLLDGVSAALSLSLSSNGFASRLFVRFMSPGCKQSGEEEYEEGRVEHRWRERRKEGTIDRRRSTKTRLLFALRQRDVAARRAVTATMCPKISRNFEIELCRRLAAPKSCALYFDYYVQHCINPQLAMEQEDGENRSAEVMRGKQGAARGFIQSSGITCRSHVRRPSLAHSGEDSRRCGPLASPSLLAR